MATVVRFGRLIDGTGAEPIEDAFIHVENERIAGVGPWREADPEVTQFPFIDARSLTGLPGLVNAHNHVAAQRTAAYRQLWQWPDTLQILRAGQRAREELDLGVTSIRDLGSMGAINIVLKRAIEMGVIQGPRVMAAGKLICSVGGHANYMGREVSGPEDARAAAREMFKAGADLLKVVASGGMGVTGVHPMFPWETYVIADTQQQELSEAEMRAAVEEAHKIGRRVAAHAYGVAAIGAALSAGVDSIEHGIWLDDRLADRMASSNVALVPTLTGIQQIVEFGPERGMPKPIVDRAKRAGEAHLVSVAIARKAGVRIATGTDSSGDMRMELEQLVTAGLSNAEALTAATRAGAETIGTALDVGTLEVGKYADILAVEGNPLVDISDIREVRLVLKGGEVITNKLSTGVGPAARRR